MRTILAVVCLLMASTDASADPMEIHSKHWVFGYPLGTPETNDLIIRNSYAMSTNDSTKFADWVAYRLTPREVMGSLDLERKWRADPWLDGAETLEPTPKSEDDYKGANSEPLKYDRGHMAPLASFKGSVDASEVNYYSNITPQAANLNQGPWKNLEEKVRAFVKKGNTVWVMTGPLYEAGMGTLPNADEPHTIPSGFWKIVLTLDGTTPKTAAFIMGQSAARNAALSGFVTSVVDVEGRSGLEFAHGPTEAVIEASTDADWLLN